MRDFDCDCMQAMESPYQYSPMMAMPQQQLETMYPRTYNIIQPAVERMCDGMTATYGTEYTPTREQVEAMIDNVYNNVEADVEAEVQQSPKKEERQFFGGRRRLLRDLIGVLLIGSLLRRRRPFYGGYPGYGYPGYGYPGFYGGGYGY